MADRENNLKIKRYSFKNGINITCIKTNKFKTNSINLFIQNRLDRSTVTQNALLPMVLRRGSIDYPTMQELSRKLEELYGSTFNIGVIKKGERQIIHFYIDGVNEKYLQSTDKLFNECSRVLNSVISKPLINNGRFKDEYLEQEKENLEKLIKSRINDKVQYAVERCWELMCEDERYGIHELGKAEDIKSIDNTALVKRYENVTKESKIDLVLIGDIDDEWIYKSEGLYNFKTSNAVKIEDDSLYKNVGDVRTFIEEMDVNQGKLSMGFRTNTGLCDKDYYPLVMYCSILGGGVHSKLFQNVREKASLAYYAFARLEKFKGLMMISSGIEASNYDKAREIILQQIEDIKKGNISEFEFNSSLKTLENGMRAMTDEPLQMADFFLAQAISGVEDDFEGTIEKIKRVKVDDVIKTAQKVKLDTVHFIKPRNGN